METPKPVLFDAHGTLCHVYRVDELAGQLFPGSGSASAAACATCSRFSD
jgi:hypothetical protein